MERFNLNTWLEDKRRKIVTRDGKPARIICYDVKQGNDDCYVPIIALVDKGEEIGEMSYYYSEDGSFLRSPNQTHNLDLFFADEEDDEFILNSFLHKLEVCDLLSNKEITWIKNKFKSIKHWKPTDKQMEELEFVTRGNSYPHLTSLYQDLKSL